MRTPANLRSYQKRAARRIYRAPDGLGVGLLVDMGLGKTISTMTGVRGLQRSGRRNSALVVMPGRVLEMQVWQDEAKLWSHTEDMKFQVVTTRKPRLPKKVPKGPKREKAQQSWKDATLATQAELQPGADFYLTDYSNLRWLAQLVGTPSQNRPKIWLPDILVLDESGYIRNHQSMRFKSLKLRLRRFFKTIVELTGTPTPNTVAEIWSQMYLIDEGRRLGTAYDRFEAQFFEPELDEHGRVPYRVFKYQPREGAIEQIMERVADITLRLDAEDWLKMPKIVPNVIPVRVPDRAMALYRKHERDMFTRLSEVKVINAVNAATLSMQCHQIANGAVYDDPIDRTSWTQIHDAKLDALEELFDSHYGQNLMVAYWFRHDLPRMLERWPDATVLTKQNALKAKEDWNAGRISKLFVQPSGNSHGLNMQHGGHVLVWFSLTWSQDRHSQLIGRLRREDNKSDTINVHYLVAKDTVDEVIYRVTGHKEQGQKRALDYLRDYAKQRGYKI